MHFGEWNHIHSNLIKINIQVTFKAHRARQIIHNIRYDGILFLKVIFFAFLVTGLKYRSAILHGIGLCTASCLLTLLFHLSILCVHATYDIEESLIVDWQDAVSIVN